MPAPSDAYLRLLHDRLAAEAPAPEATDVATTAATTRAWAWGGDGGAIFVLVPGFGATALAWAPVARALADAGHRAVVLDVPGDAGESVAHDGRLRTADDLVGWLDETLSGLGIGDDVHLVGHSYGGWVATTYALARPDRLASLTLVDGSQVLARDRVGYLVRALPLLVRPSRQRHERFVGWETGGRVGPAWAEVAGAAAEEPSTLHVRPRRPSASDLAALAVPTLALLATEGRAMDADAAERAAAAVPAITIARLTGVGHHSLPALGHERVTRLLLARVTA